MTYTEALDFIHSVLWQGSRPGLERITALLHALGDPQKTLRFVHIAGTNGKGSTAAMTAAVLRAAGYRTGLYTSPYINRFNERMQIDGVPIGDEALAALTEETARFALPMEDRPTEFEVITALAMLWFARQRCDIVVLEVGMGGRLDATNVIEACECAIIANIGLDHTAVLGNTVGAIAGEKAGIIKTGVPCVLYQQGRETTEVVEAVCRARQAPLTTADFGQLALLSADDEGQHFTYRGQPRKIGLLGAHQLRNAAVVLETVEVLRQRGWAIPEEAVNCGLAEARWPARFEILAHDPPFVVDGGHNPQGAETAVAALAQLFPRRRHVLLMGVLADKDVAAILDILCPAADCFVTVTPDSPRAMSAEELASLLRARGKAAQPCADIPGGVALARELAGTDGMVLSVGSLYMAGAVRACVLEG